MEDDLSLAAVKALESATSAHKRIDEHHDELLSLRDAKHKHNGMLHNHQGILTGISEAITQLGVTVKNQIMTTEKNTEALIQFKTIALTAVFLGTGFVSFCVFVGGTILKWW